MRARIFATLAILVILFAACNGPEATSKNILDTEVALYSQLAEELIARDFFQDRRGGVFLDVGCSTPISNNTTYYLEKHLGWTGIGVDALPVYGAAWEIARPNSVFRNYAVTETTGDTVPFYPGHVWGVSSLSERHVKMWGGGGEPIEVPTITLTKLLDDHGIEAIDFLSIDIEGAEPGALRGFDIDRFRPALICIEVGIGDANDAFILSYFTAHGYELIEMYKEYDHVNSYFRRQHESEISRKGAT